MEVRRTSLRMIKYQIAARLLKVTLIKVLLRLQHKHCSLGQAHTIISTSLGVRDTTSEKLAGLIFKRRVNGKRTRRRVFAALNETALSDVNKSLI